MLKFTEHKLWSRTMRGSLLNRELQNDFPGMMSANMLIEEWGLKKMTNNDGSATRRGLCPNLRTCLKIR